ncbi:unnamed protein product [Musa acuminata subsp. burmannicoides]
MVRDRDEPPAVRVYTVCDESRYLIVRNVPALGCGDDLSRLFGSYGEIEECKPMDAENCDPFTDVYWIKFSQVSNARFAKRKLDESVFLGNLLKVSYAPQFESVLDVKEKLEGRTKEVLGRIKSANVRTEGSKSQISSNSNIIGSSCQHWLDPAPSASSNSELQGRQREFARGGQISHVGDAPLSHVSSNKEYFPTPSMNETVRLVREKLDKIQSRSGNTDTASASKRAKGLVGNFNGSRGIISVVGNNFEPCPRGRRGSVRVRMTRISWAPRAGQCGVRRDGVAPQARTPCCASEGPSTALHKVRVECCPPSTIELADVEGVSDEEGFLCRRELERCKNCPLEELLQSSKIQELSTRGAPPYIQSSSPVARPRRPHDFTPPVSLLLCVLFLLGYCCERGKFGRADAWTPSESAEEPSP